MPFINRLDYVRGLEGLSFDTLTIGTAAVENVLAVPQEDVSEDAAGNVQRSQPYYQLNLPLDSGVAVGAAVTIPVSDTRQFVGKVSDLDTDIIRDCQWATVRGQLNAVSP